MQQSAQTQTKYVKGQSCTAKGLEHKYLPVDGAKYDKCSACGSTRTKRENLGVGHWTEHGHWISAPKQGQTDPKSTAICVVRGLADVLADWGGPEGHDAYEAMAWDPKTGLKTVFEWLKLFEKMGVRFRKAVEAGDVVWPGKDIGWKPGVGYYPPGMRVTWQFENYRTGVAGEATA